MEETKKIYKFEGEEGEDFHIWAARTEAALEAKDVLSAVTADLIGDESSTVSPTVKLSIAKARATVIQGLGNKPLRLVLPVRGNPFKMWKLLKERYAVSNLVTKVQLHTKLARMEYKGQAMSEHITEFENIFNQLAGMGSTLNEDMKIATFLASFGDKSRSSFGHVVTVLQSKYSTTSWETVSSVLLQEYEEQLCASTVKQPSKRASESTIALTATGQRGHRNSTHQQKRKGPKSKDRLKCWECGLTGHFARDHKNNKSLSGDGNVNRDNGKFGQAHHATMLMAVQKGMVEEAIELLVDSGASDNMVNRAEYLTDLEEIPKKVIVLGNGDSVTATHQGI